MTRNSLASYVLRRIVQAIPTILGIITINFIVLHLAPGDAADVLAGEAGSADPEYMRQLRERFGLDAPLYLQYAKYIWNIAQLDLGYSFRHSMPVSTLIAERLPVTLVLMLSTFATAIVFGVLFGLVAARFVGTLIDWSISTLALVSYSMPVFWVGLMLIVLFSVHLGWLPSGGYETIGSNLTGLGRFFDIARHMVMPITALSLLYLAVYSRLMRASFLDVDRLDFVRTAHAKGLSPNRVAFKHVLRNALIPIVTMAGLHLSALLGGAVIIEQVFALPGLGRLAFDAVFQRDFNLLLSILVLSSILVIFINLVIDLVYVLIDPRIEVR